MLADPAQLPLLPDAPAPRAPCVRCPTCRRPLGALAARRAAVQRAATYAAEWSAFVAARPGAIAKIIAYALRLAETPGRVAIAKVWEDCRRRIKGGLDQNHRAPASRWLSANVPGLAGRFSIRNTAGDPARRRA